MSSSTTAPKKPRYSTTSLLLTHLTILTTLIDRFFLIQILYYLLEQLQQSQLKLHYSNKRKKRNQRKSKAPSSYLMVSNYSVECCPLPLLELKSVPFVRCFCWKVHHVNKQPLVFTEIKSSFNKYNVLTGNISLQCLFLCLDCEHQQCKYCFDNLWQFH